MRFFRVSPKHSDLGCSLDLQKEVGQGLLPSGAVIVGKVPD
jgi:hypothetical protein